jgi:hypothetical protein
VLGAATSGLIGSGGANIVFGVARDDARFAAGAAIKVEDHGPFVSHFVFFLSRSFGRTAGPW